RADHHFIARRLGRGLERYREARLLADPQHAELRRAAERLGHEAILEGIRVIDRLAVNRHDHVAGLEAGTGGRTAGAHPGDERTGRTLEAEIFRDLGGDGLQLGAEPWPLDRAAAAPRRAHHDLHHVRWDRKTDADRAARARVDRRVDSGELAVDVDQGAAGIARIDGGVGL